MKTKKEISGYRLIKPEYKEAVKLIGNFSSLEFFEVYKTFKEHAAIYELIVKKLEEAGVLDLWFEPVYSESLKAGDWVTIIQNYVDDKGKTFQITQEMLNNKPWTYTLEHKVFGAYKFPSQIRLAVKEEIANIQEKVYTLGIDEKFEIVVKDKRAFYGDKEMTYDIIWLQDMYKNSLNKNMNGAFVFVLKDMIMSESRCINKNFLLSQWLEIDLN